MNTELFRTVVPINKAPSLISPFDYVIFMGSCFANKMGKFMSEARFPVMINPYGVLYNPVSISQSFESIINNTPVNEDQLFYTNGLWHSFFHHGKFNNPDQDIIIQQINNATFNAHNFLKHARFVIITFGSSFVYEHKHLNKVVANCHKFHEDNFIRYILEPDEIIDLYKDLIVKLRVFNPEINIILTISPVRHLKDGAHGNQLSKAVLLLALEKITSLFEKTWYFPAYEIMLDELRDYRFYDDAMTQPNETAIKYIWSRFTETNFSCEGKNFIKEVQKVIRARNHRHSGHNTVAYRAFLRQSLDLIYSLSARYPGINLESDLDFFQQKFNDSLL